MRDADRQLAPRSNELDRRRLIGLGIVVTVLLIAIVVGTSRTRVMTGSAVAPPVAPGPGIGDCLAKNFYKSDVDLTAWGTDLPSLEMGPCTGSRFGEVVYVETDFGQAMAATEPAENPYLQCRTEADRYLGVPPRPHPDEGLPIAPTPSDPAFWTTTEVLVAFIGPDPRQLVAGQQWAACVVHVPGSLLAQAPITVAHSLQGSWLRDGDKSLFSFCVSSATSHVAINCRWPHRFEMIDVGGTHPASPSG